MMELPSKVITKIESAVDRYEELTKQMSAPEVATNPSKLIELSKEHAELERIVKPYQEYCSLKRQIDDSRSILNSPDSSDDLKQLAREEMQVQVERRQPCSWRIYSICICDMLNVRAGRLKFFLPLRQTLVVSVRSS